MNFNTAITDDPWEQFRRDLQSAGYLSPPTALKCCHVFPDTGMRKSWCRSCQIEGVWNNTTCCFESAE